MRVMWLQSFDQWGSCDSRASTNEGHVTLELHDWYSFWFAAFTVTREHFVSATLWLRPEACSPIQIPLSQRHRQLFMTLLVFCQCLHVLRRFAVDFAQALHLYLSVLQQLCTPTQSTPELSALSTLLVTFVPGLASCTTCQLIWRVWPHDWKQTNRKFSVTHMYRVKYALNWTVQPWKTLQYWLFYNRKITWKAPCPVDRSPPFHSRA